MVSKAFSAGVVPGGLRDKNEIKILICYIIEKIEIPLKKSDVILVLQTYGLANYFETSEAFSELESNGSIKNIDDKIEITSQGKIIVEELSQKLPLTVKDKALKLIKSYTERMKIEKENKVIIRENKYGFDVTCIISGGNFEMLKLTLYAPDKEFANTIKNNFYKNPGQVYNYILSLVTGQNFTSNSG